MINPNTHTIAHQNDQFRQELKVSLRRMDDVTLPGAYATTSTVGALSRARYFELIREVIAFDTFTEDNDPDGEHDFGGINIAGDRYFWKIDYYANDTCEWGSNDPSDPSKCYRVMTISTPVNTDRPAPRATPWAWHRQPCQLQLAGVAIKHQDRERMTYDTPQRPAHRPPVHMAGHRD